MFHRKLDRLWIVKIKIVKDLQTEIRLPPESTQAFRFNLILRE